MTTEKTDSIDKFLDTEMKKEFRPSVVRPSNTAAMVQAATDPNTERASTHMIEQMEKVILNLEKDINEAAEVRHVVNKRIADLTNSLNAARALWDVLRK